MAFIFCDTRLLLVPCTSTGDTCEQVSRVFIKKKDKKKAEKLLRHAINYTQCFVIIDVGFMNVQRPYCSNIETNHQVLSEGIALKIKNFFIALYL